MTDRERLILHSALLCCYGALMMLPGGNDSDAMGWALFCALVAVSLLGWVRAFDAHYRLRLRRQRTYTRGARRHG